MFEVEEGLLEVENTQNEEYAQSDDDDNRYKP